MELQWTKSPCTYLQTNVHQVMTQEQSQELRLPDGMPDIGRVLCAWGQSVVRSKEWRSDGMSVSGGVTASVLYLPEDGSNPRCAECWIPFQMKWSFPQSRREGSIRTQCQLRSLEARTISARKMMVRASVIVMGTALEPGEAEVATPGEVPAGVELLKKTYPMVIPREAGEKPFMLEEEIEVSGVQKWVSWQLSPEVTEQSVMGNRVVLRGVGELTYIYLDEEGNLKSGIHEIPFAQFAELDREYDKEATADVVIEVNSLESETMDAGAKVQCAMTAQYLVWNRQMIEVAEDAYSPKFDLTVEQQKLQLPVLLESKMEKVSLHADSQAGKPLVQTFLPDFPGVYREENEISVEFQGVLQSVFEDEEGNLKSTQETCKDSISMAACADCRISAEISSCHALDSGAAMKVKLQTTAMQTIPMITGLTIGQSKQEEKGKPSLILRRMDADSLWDLAKESGSTVSAIVKANQLSGEPAQGQMLLIPVS